MSKEESSIGVDKRGELTGRIASPMGDATSGDRGLGHSLPGVTVHANPFNDGLRFDEAVVGLVSGSCCVEPGECPRALDAGDDAVANEGDVGKFRTCRVAGWTDI